MDEILLWPVLKDLSLNGHFTCVISAKFDIIGRKAERTQKVQIVADKPVTLWFPEARVPAHGIATIGIDDCRDEEAATVQLHAFPHLFQVSTIEQIEQSTKSQSSLVCWDDMNEVPLDPGPRHLQFILSTRAPTLPIGRNQTRNVISPINTDTTFVAEQSRSFSLARLLVLCAMLAIGKIFLVKVIRTLKPACEAVHAHFDTFSG